MLPVLLTGLSAHAATPPDPARRASLWLQLKLGYAADDNENEADGSRDASLTALAPMPLSQSVIRASYLGCFNMCPVRWDFLFD